MQVLFTIFMGFLVQFIQGALGDVLFGALGLGAQ